MTDQYNNLATQEESSRKSFSIVMGEPVISNPNPAVQKNVSNQSISNQSFMSKNWKVFTCSFACVIIILVILGVVLLIPQPCTYFAGEQLVYYEGDCQNCPFDCTGGYPTLSVQQKNCRLQIDCYPPQCCLVMNQNNQSSST